MNEKMLHRLLAAFVLVFSFIIYLSTMAPTVSFWDCGEFIACSYRLAVPHPPGSPYFLMLGRVFTLIPLFENIAARVNFISVLSSAFTVMLLYLIIVHFAKRMLNKTEFSFYDKIGIYGGGVVGSLVFAFTHSFWFNAVEAEVYALSMLFTSLVVYLVLLWEHHSEEEGNEKYILMIAYLIGLAIGVHMLNVLALPFVFLIIYFKRKEFNTSSFIKFILYGGFVFLLVYPGIIYGVPLIAEKAGFMGLLLFIVALFVLFMVTRKTYQSSALILLSLLLILLGYSTYAMIYIRSNLDPVIDENDPETIERFVSYLNREQYGEHFLSRTRQWKQSPNGKRYKSAGEFFWKYQVNYMYNRYFLWQFLGRADDEENVDPFKFYMLPMLLGLIGMFYHFSRDSKNAFSIFVLFFMTGLAIILYLNQPDPQPRERDYSYVGSFFAFAIWVGLGLPAILQLLKERIGESKAAGYIALVISLFTPTVMLAKNYDSQDRTGNYLAWDYSYNLLNSCEPNGILITNGDNDTFPLWYLQEVEGIRKDVRVVNLSLLNTPWYIHQLKTKEPKVPITLSDKMIDQIEGLVYRPWKTKKIRIDVPKALQKAEYKEKIKQMAPLKDMTTLPADTMGYIEFQVKPHLMNYSLRVQDYMFLHILTENKWKRPIYVSLTVSDDNQLDELRNYRRIDGLVYKITTQRGWKMNPDKMETNILTKYKFRGLNDRSVYIPLEHKSLISNYRNIIYQLNEYYLRSGQIKKSQRLIKYLVSHVDLDYFPLRHWQPKMWEYLNITAAGVYPADSLLHFAARLAKIQNANDPYVIENGIMYNINALYYNSPYFRNFYEKMIDKYRSDKRKIDEIWRYYKQYLRNRKTDPDSIKIIENKIFTQKSKDKPETSKKIQ